MTIKMRGIEKVELNTGMKWISVETEPEKPHDKHLIFDGTEMYIGWMVFGDWEVCTDGITIAGDATFGDDDTWGPITHWAPLPPVPGESDSSSFLSRGRGESGESE